MWSICYWQLAAFKKGSEQANRREIEKEETACGLLARIHMRYITRAKCISNAVCLLKLYLKFNSFFSSAFYGSFLFVRTLVLVLPTHSFNWNERFISFHSSFFWQQFHFLSCICFNHKNHKCRIFYVQFLFQKWSKLNVNFC